jgi:hypothetical protein
MEPLATAASKALSPGSANELTDLDKALYLEAARMLLGSYRTGEANDPDVYVAAVVRVLSGYPMEIVNRVIDPLTGIPSKIKWLPKPFEIKQACEEIHGSVRRAREWEERAARQLAERREWEAGRETRPSLVALKATYGDTFGLEPDKRRQVDNSAPLDPSFARARLGISQAEWDAIPDAPRRLR